jgi:Zn-dependent protease with chaperone function
MATDFFDRQDAARRNTTRLVVLFVLAVLAIMVSIHLLLAAAFGYLSYDERTGGRSLTLLDPGIAALAFLGTLVTVGGGSLYKVAQLRGGGRVVAEQLGGRLLSPDTTEPSERQLMNVVEEMAIAAGTTTPPVYLLEQEDGINAFAAGFAPGEAVIGVTNGAARRLSRDELQGVIAHEFSHILNGDMRLNIRLIGLLHGILIIGTIGYFLLRMTAFSGHRRRRSRDQGNGALPLLAVGAGLMVVGFFGTFFGNLIKAAVSRQREFLADAAAVQFTRQPDGIAGALKKIGAVSAGSAIRNPNAPEASHMFFGRATSGFSALFSTHPPLPKRIRAIDPTWDGTFPEVASGTPPVQVRHAAAVGFASGGAGTGHAAGGALGALDHVGHPTEAHIRYAARLLESLPDAIRSAAHEPYGARALVYSLLLDREAALRDQQLQHLQRAADPGVFVETLKLAPVVSLLPTGVRLPVVEIALPALRVLTAEQYRSFKQNVAVLVEADEHIDLFEWALQRILIHDLDVHHGSAKPQRVRHQSLTSVRTQCELLLSMLAHAGHRDEQAAAQAFEAAREALGLPDARMRRVDQADLGSLDAALTDLEEAAPRIKQRVLEAVVACITADRQVTANEAELLRAVSASLGVPMPPLLDV